MCVRFILQLIYQVLPHLPLEVVAGGGDREIPLIVGAWRDEVQLWEVMQGAQFAPADEVTLLAEMTKCVGAEIAPALLRAYRMREPDASLARLRMRFLSDWIYRVPAVRCAEAQMRVEDGHGAISSRTLLPLS